MTSSNTQPEPKSDFADGYYSLVMLPEPLGLVVISPDGTAATDAITAAESDKPLLRRLGKMGLAKRLDHPDAMPRPEAQAKGVIAELKDTTGTEARRIVAKMKEEAEARKEPAASNGGGGDGDGGAGSNQAGD